MAKTAARKGKTPARKGKGKAPARKAATKTPVARKAAAKAPAAPVSGKARQVIVTLASRKEGATSAELFAATGWKYASWSHQLKLITKAAGTPHRIAKVDGTTRYFVGA